MHGGVVEPARLLFCAPSSVPRSAIIHFSHSDITDNRLATQHCGTACCLQRGQCYNVQAAGAPTGKQFTSPGTIAYQLATRTGARGTHFLRLCAPARPTRARAGTDGRADSTALRSATRALPPCAAGLMHSTRAHGAGIAAIAAIRQSPRDGIPNLINCCQRIGLDAQRRYRDSGSCTDETVRGRPSSAHCTQWCNKMRTRPRTRTHALTKLCVDVQ